MLYPICYFVVCFTLQQCIDFSDDFTLQNINPKLDMFYWEQGAVDEIPASAHQLEEIMSVYPELDRWQKLKPVGSMHWIPYYYYYYSQHDSDECSSYVKFTPDTRLTSPQSELQLSESLLRAKQDRAEALISLEPTCTPHQPINSFHAVIDMHKMMQMLSFYQVEARRLTMPIYPENHLDNWLSQNPGQMATTNRDLTACVSDTTSTEERPYYKIQVQSPFEAFQEEEAKIQEDGACPLAVF